MSQKLVLVMGATGAQGGSVVNALLKTGKYRIRGLTRNPEAEKAKQLAAKGVEVVAGDVNDVPSLKKALQGAWAVFAVTNFWDPSVGLKEEEIGKSLVDATKEAGVEYFIWSDLPDVYTVSHDKYYVPHFTGKARVAQYAISKGLKTLRISPAFYYSNFMYFFPPKRNEQGEAVFSIPMAPHGYITAFDVDDTGDVVAATLENPEKWVNKYLPIAGDHMKVEDYIKTYARVTGDKAVYNPLDPVAFSQGGEVAKELADMCSWFTEYGYFGPGADLEVVKKELFPGLKTFEQWLKVTGWRAP